ncbi:MAG: sigma-54 dependent transcriptional regulator [Planctomycetota bacterium]
MQNEKPRASSCDGVAARKSPDDWLGALARRYRDERHKLEPLALETLEKLAEELDFSRGYFIIHRLRPSSAGRDGSRELNFDVYASRLRLDGLAAWVDVTNPDFAVSRPVVRLALDSRELVVLEGEAGAGGTDAPGARPALCRSFDLGDTKIGVLYLERDFATGVIDAASRQAFDRFVDVFAPIYSEASGCPAREAAPVLQPGVSEASDRQEEAGRADSPTRVADDPVDSFFGIIGRDEKMLKIFEIIEKVKDSDLNVCICGESGTGKELIARAIHQSGHRSRHAFVSENCGAISESLLESELFGHLKGSFTGADEDREGLFSAADKGTLFLDEISDMSQNMQRKLLRVLQEGMVRPIGSKTSIQVDSRIVCASNTDLKHLVERDQFRADLFYRLNVITIEVPPLRQRRGDIPLLIDDFLSRLGQEEGVEKRFSISAMKALVEYGWPGNVRELWNVLRKVLLTCEEKEVARKHIAVFLNGSTPGAGCLGEGIEKDADHLLLRIPQCESFNEIIEQCERLVLFNALTEYGWNKSRVTRALGIPRQSLYNKITRYDLKRPVEQNGECD